MVEETDDVVTRSKQKNQTEMNAHRISREGKEVHSTTTNRWSIHIGKEGDQVIGHHPFLPHPQPAEDPTLPNFRVMSVPGVNNKARLSKLRLDCGKDDRGRANQPRPPTAC